MIDKPQPEQKGAPLPSGLTELELARDRDNSLPEVILVR